MALSMTTALRNSRSEEINTLIGAGGKVKFYSGPAPANVGAAATGDLLADCTCNASGFGTVTSGVLEADVVSGQSYVARDSSANNTGTIGYARITDSSGNAVLQFSTVGTTGSGQEIELPSIFITAGEAVEVVSISITEGNS